LLDSFSGGLRPMIFKKILKGTDLAVDLTLEKTHYAPGEIVRGTLGINTEKGSKARKLVLLAEGKESTTITVTETTGIGSRRDTTSKTYNETNVFFSKDLSNFLQKSVVHNLLQDGSLEILPQNKVIAFDFTLPADNKLFSSYKGKHANITYTIKGTVDIANKLDVNKEERFSVINPKNRTVGYTSSNSSFDEENKSDAVNPHSIENPENILPPPITDLEEKHVDEGSYEAQFEQIFGKKANPVLSKNSPRYLRFTGTGMSFDLETIFAKGREDFLKESTEAKIKLIDQSNNITSYAPGHTVRGDVILRLTPEEKEEIRNKIRGMKITLSGIEHAFAQGLQRVSTIEKYDKDIEIDGNQIGGQNGINPIPFELVIPQGVNQSYIGKYSEYFWGLEAKVNIAWSSDLIAKTIIEIV
jgi:Arrestin (or S-antigen), N-terminal domain